MGHLRTCEAYIPSEMDQRVIEFDNEGSGTIIRRRERIGQEFGSINRLGIFLVMLNFSLANELKTNLKELAKVSPGSFQVTESLVLFVLFFF